MKMKRIAPILFLILLSTALHGQFSDPMVINPGFNTLEKVVAFDIGNEGRTDLIALVDNEVRWLAPLENQPDRYILKQALPAGPSFAKPIWLNDLDHDGDADILTVIQQLGTYYLAWFTYDGAGFFKPFELIEALPGKPTAWASGNLDPDPVKEYALLIQGTVHYYNLENFSGAPVFSTAPVDAIGFAVDHFDLSDMNADGLDDLVAGFGVVIVWYPNNTSFAISFDSEVIVSSDVIDVQMFAFGDIDGDGDTDIAAVPGNADKVVWFKNGDGLGQVFSSPKNLLQPFEDGLQVYLTDLDQDGDLDGVGTRQNLGLYWAENSNGAGQFTNPSAIKTLAGDPLNFSTVQAIHDIDGDDFPDFLLRYRAADTIAVGWLNNALAFGDNFAYQPPVLSNTRFVKSMDAGDYDQDGDVDFVALSGRGGPWNQDKLTLYETQDNNTIYQIALTSTVTAPNVNGQPDYQPLVRFNDVDQDGDLDILAFINWKLILLENIDGEGQFSSPQEIYQFPTEAGYAITLSDLNQNSLPDIVGRTTALLNQPNLSDFSIQDLGFVNNIKRSQPIDFDSDGDQDVLLLRSTSTEDLFFLAENLDGQGTNWDLYPMNTFEPDLLNWQDFFPIDYDKDGDDDLLYIKHEPLDHLVWQEQVSPGVFSNSLQPVSPIPLLAGINPLNFQNFFLVDINADDWEDFVFSDQVTNSIFVLFRTPGVNFLSEIVEVAGGLDSDYFLTGFRDVTGNGRPDFLLTADAPKGYVAWIRNFLGSSAADQGKLEVFTYVDNDGNGSYQPTIDAPLPGIKMAIQPNDVTAISSARGISQVPVGSGTEYTLNLLGDPNWTLTSGPASLAFMPDTLYEATIEFGLSPNQPVYDLDQLYAHSPAICDAEVQQWFTVMNTGNQTSQAWAEISFSPANLLIPFFNSSTQPDSVTASHNYWRFDQITPGEAEAINFICQSAGAQFEGQTVQVHFAVYYYDQNGNFLFVDSQDYQYDFQCTEPSNRKTVLPLRIEPERYFVEEDLFHYRILYQNPTTAPLQGLQISDRLDPNLDWNTFRPVTSSHYFETLLSNPTGEAVFQFPNLELTDGPEASGYLEFTIAPKLNLEEGAAVKNFAELYFAQLPEIRTDTVFNTFTRCGTPDPALNMMIFPGPEMLEAEICVGDSVEVGGTFYSEAGNYFIEMSSSEGCDSSLILSLSHLPPIELAGVEIVHDDGTNNGSITPEFNGGVPPYHYEWANGAIEPMIFGLTGGEYTLFVTDAGGCTASFQFSITEPSASNSLAPPGFQVAPNPVAAGEVVELTGPAFRLHCFNSQGREVDLEVRQRATGTTLTAPDQGGIYWLRGETAEYAFLFKLVVIE